MASDTASDPSSTSPPLPSNQPVRGSLTLEVTTRCHRSCAYCYNVWTADPSYTREELSAADLVSLVTGALHDSGLRHVQISGGEPLLRPDLWSIIEGIRRTGARVSLISDAGLIDDQAAGNLVRLGVGPVQPTLLAANRDLHDELKGGDAFDQTIAAMGRLLRRRVPVTAAYLCTARNYRAFREVIELCFALGIKTVAFNRLCLAGKALGRAAELMPTPDMIASCLEVASWARSRLGMRVIIAISLPLCCTDLRRFPDLKFGRCALHSEHPGFTIDPAGNLRACSISSTILGNLTKDRWEVLMARSRDRYFPEMTAIPEACRPCPVVSRCGGGCRESALQYFGDLEHPDPLARPFAAVS